MYALTCQQQSQKLKRCSLSITTTRLKSICRFLHMEASAGNPIRSACQLTSDTVRRAPVSEAVSCVDSDLAACDQCEETSDGCTEENQQT